MLVNLPLEESTQSAAMSLGRSEDSEYTQSMLYCLRLETWILKVTELVPESAERAEESSRTGSKRGQASVCEVFPRGGASPFGPALDSCF